MGSIPRSAIAVGSFGDYNGILPAMSANLPIILLPGIGLDERLYAAQSLAFPELRVPAWLRPRYFESLPSYAKRMAVTVDPGGPCYVGGVSLGGMIALEMSRHLDCRGVFLISSIRSRDELPLWARFFAPWAWVVPPRADVIASTAGKLTLWTIGRFLPARWRMFCVHLSKTRATILPWACRAAVRWRPTGKYAAPIHHLHGDQDPIFPHHHTQATQIVPRGGHLLTLTHPFVVNEFLRQGMAHTVAGSDSLASDARV
jgi:pimeloyl-ACP methyl ester carboxylesterase